MNLSEVEFPLYAFSKNHTVLYIGNIRYIKVRNELLVLDNLNFPQETLAGRRLHIKENKFTGLTAIFTLEGVLNVKGRSKFIDNKGKIFTIESGKKRKYIKSYKINQVIDKETYYLIGNKALNSLFKVKSINIVDTPYISVLNMEPGLLLYSIDREYKDQRYILL